MLAMAKAEPSIRHPGTDPVDQVAGQAPGETAGQIGEAVESLVGLAPHVQGKLLLSLVVLVAIWIAHRIVLRTVHRRLQDPRTRYLWSKNSGYVAFTVAVLVVGFLWLDAFGNLATFLGLLSAGLAIALRDLVSNMAGWAFIVLRHPFVVGDRIQVGDERGDVVDIRLFQFTLLEIGNWVDADQSTGRVIHVPNARVFTDPVANYTSQFAYLWHEIPVLVTFESNWRKAKGILEKVARDHASELVSGAEEAVRHASRKYLIFYGTLTPKIYTGVKESGVLLTLRFICPVRQRRGLSEKIWEAILEAFGNESDIDLAYPTRRFYANFLEGKEEARAPVSLPTVLRSDEPGEGESPGSPESAG
jgi:small-conductance mechanosensitive channel